MNGLSDGRFFVGICKCSGLAFCNALPFAFALYHSENRIIAAALNLTPIQHDAVRGAFQRKLFGCGNKSFHRNAALAHRHNVSDRLAHLINIPDAAFCTPVNKDVTIAGHCAYTTPLFAFSYFSVYFGFGGILILIPLKLYACSDVFNRFYLGSGNKGFGLFNGAAVTFNLAVNSFQRISICFRMLYEPVNIGIDVCVINIGKALPAV